MRRNPSRGIEAHRKVMVQIRRQSLTRWLSNEPEPVVDSPAAPAWWARSSLLAPGALLRTLQVCVVRLEAGPSRKNAVRKLLHVGVVVLQGVVIALAFDGDAVLGACEFVLQAQKVFVRLQLRIIFHDQQQAADRSIELSVGGDLLLWSARREQG